MVPAPLRWLSLPYTGTAQQSRCWSGWRVCLSSGNTFGRVDAFFAELGCKFCHSYHPPAKPENLHFLFRYAYHAEWYALGYARKRVTTGFDHNTSLASVA